jgi:hypothetical protein
MPGESQRWNVREKSRAGGNPEDASCGPQIVLPLRHGHGGAAQHRHVPCQAAIAAGLGWGRCGLRTAAFRWANAASATNVEDAAIFIGTNTFRAAWWEEKDSPMAHETTVEKVTNRVWGIFSSLDHRIADNNDRRTLLRVYIASLAERGEHNADRLTVDGLVYLKGLTSRNKQPAKRRA